MPALTRPLFLFVAMALASALAAAAPDQSDFSDTIKVFKNAGESSTFFGKSYGYAVFPSIGKAGVGIGGARGKGQVYAGGTPTGNVTMTQVTYGLQLGGQVYSQIIFFEDQRAYDEFISGNFEFGAQATAVALTAGVSAEASSAGGTSAGVSGGRNDATTAHGGFRKGMAIFTVAKGGLMYEATLGGQKFKYTPL